MRMKALGNHGIAAAVLALGAAAVLAADSFGMLEQPWAATASAGAGIIAALLGCIGLARHARQTPPPSAPAGSMAALDGTMDNMAALLRSMAEEMVRLKRDGAEASRGMAEARGASIRLVEASATAIARLDESAESSAIAARALSMLPGIADQHAQRIEMLAARAEQALALVPDAMATHATSHTAEAAAILEVVEAALAKYVPVANEGLDAAIARLDSLPAEVGAAMHAGMTQQHAGEVALLEAAIARVEAAKADPMLAVGLMEATERLESVVHQFENNPPRGDAPPGPDPEELAGRLHAALAPSLAEVLSRRLTAIADAASRHREGAGDGTAEFGARLDGAMDRLSQDVSQRIAAALAECEARPAQAAVAGPALSDISARLDAAASSLASLAQTLPVAVRDAAITRLDAGAEDLRVRCASLIEALPQAVIARAEERLGALAEGLAAAAACMAGLVQTFPDAVRDAAAARLDTGHEDLRARCASLVEALPAAVIAQMEERFGALADGLAAVAACMAGLFQTLPDAVRDAASARLDVSADDLRARCASLIEALPQAIIAQLEARFGALADGLAAASAGFPAAAEGLQSHLDALETLGPVLDGVTERLIQTADALAATGGSLQPMADTARRAMDSLSTSARVITQQRPIKPIPAAPQPEAPPVSVAASILGQMAAQEEPAMAATLRRLDGLGSEVASLLRETEGLVGQAGTAGLTRPVAQRAPEMLESLHETIRGLQSISTAIAVAADRKLDFAQAG